MSSLDPRRTLDALRTMIEQVHLATPGQVPDVVALAAGRLGWGAAVYLADYEQQHLVPLPVAGAPAGRALAIDGTLAGRAYRLVQAVVVHGEEPGAWLPLLDGSHRLGVLRFTVPRGTDLADPTVEDACRLLAHTAGHLLMAKIPYGDALSRASRTRTRTVATELLWDLLPPLTFGCEGLVVSAILEPCYEVAADAFDYSVVDGVAHVAVFDATGHDLDGTVLAAVALAALRNSRREGRDLVDSVRRVDQLVAEQGGGRLFVTGVVGRLELATGRLQYVNAGHPLPLVMRGNRVVKELGGGRRTILGFGCEEIPVGEEWLEPQDTVVLYTDGITEARDEERRLFGRDRLVGHLERSAAGGLPAPEMLRRLMHDVLRYQRGVLQDDATIVIAQWSTGEEHRLASTGTPATAPDAQGRPRR